VKVLILDDDIPILKYYAMILGKLQSAPSYVLCATEEEFVIGMQSKPDIILSDIKLGKTDGPTILRKHSDTIKNTPIFLLSCADNIKSLADELRDDGIKIVDVMQKPITPLMLKSILE
tara:strand:- start:126 stop:479 length:354 start_codon:yes stop_codon:yes gene_type:complete